MKLSVPWFSDSATCACSTMCRYSPCTGTKYFGRTSDVDDLQFFLRRVPAHVHVGDAVVEHVRAELEQIVDRAVHQRFVAGHGRRRQDHHVALDDLHMLVVLVCHACERRGRLALAAGRDDRQLVVRARSAARARRRACPPARAGSRVRASPPGTHAHRRERDRRTRSCRARAARARARASASRERGFVDLVARLRRNLRLDQRQAERIDLPVQDRAAHAVDRDALVARCHRRHERRRRASAASPSKRSSASVESLPPLQASSTGVARSFAGAARPACGCWPASRRRRASRSRRRARARRPLRRRGSPCAARAAFSDSSNAALLSLVNAPS